MPRPARARQLTAQERQLAREQEALRRRELELEQALRTIPAQIEKKRRIDEEAIRRRVTGSAPAISLGLAKAGRSNRSGGTRGRRLPASELQTARVKFIVLCLILATLVLLLWRAIPG